MARFKRVMFRGIVTEVTIDAETPFGTPEYLPGFDAQLVGVIVVAGGVDAASLIENGHIRLDSESFGGRYHVTEFEGVGLETVPRGMKKKTVDMTPDLPVKSASKIEGKYYHNVLPVTPELVVYGIFEN